MYAWQEKTNAHPIVVVLKVAIEVASLIRGGREFEKADAQHRNDCFRHSGLAYDITYTFKFHLLSLL